MSAEPPAGKPARSNPLTGALNWLLLGYPQGIPRKDYIPLIALLRPRLSDEDLDRIVGTLVGSGHLPADRADIDAAIGQVSSEPPSEEDVARVAARLAAAGWPLAPIAETAAPVATVGTERGERQIERPAFLRSMIGWLRAGYPQGVPEHDYVPLFALLRRRLADEEIGFIVDELVADGRSPFGSVDIAVLITKVTNEMPHYSDTARVRERLESAGWNVEPPVL